MNFFSDRTPQLPEGVSLIHGNAFQYLRGLDDGAVDHIITDPPYAERTHLGALTNTPGVKLTTERLVTFDHLTDEQFLLLCREAVRVSRRWVIMTCDFRHAALAEMDESLPVVRVGVWIKPDSVCQFTGDRPGMGWESVLILHRPTRKKWNGGGHHAVWTFNLERGEHPTSKPLALWRKWVRQFTDPGDVILDPFAGGGVTAEAAVLEGRKAILVEKDVKWIEAIRRRLNRPFPPPILRDPKTGDEVLF